MNLLLRLTSILACFGGLHGFAPGTLLRAAGDSALHMSTESALLGAPQLCSTLKKPSKVLTVGVEYSGGALSETELGIESMQLRKSKVSAIWCTEIGPLQEFSKEQESARGDFPGPCPVIYFGELGRLGDAVESGASAVVLASEDDVGVAAGCEIVWKVSTVESVQQVLERTDGQANAFLLEGTTVEDASSIMDAIPKSALTIATVEAMQADGVEVVEAKEFKKLGVASILVRQACMGDEEDLEYAQYVVGGMTSKASSEFKFSGLTGSTNGHFGGVQSNSSVKWQRVQ